MRILFISPFYKPFLGSTERVIERLCAEFSQDERVEAVAVLTSRANPAQRSSSDLPTFENVDGVDVFRCPLKPAGMPGFFNAALSGYVSPEIKSCVQKFRPDVVHFLDGEWWAAKGAYLASRNAVHVLSAFPALAPTERKGNDGINHWLAERMDAVHLLSDRDRDCFGAIMDGSADNTVVIPPGVEAVQNVPDRTERDPVIVLSLGRLNRDHGQLQLVRMFDQLLQETRRHRVELWLIGEDGGDRAEIERYVAENNLQALVRVVGRCSDEALERFYADADIFALPSQSESFALGVTEAMTHGLPAVTYKVGSLSSRLTAGALTVPLNDEQAFREALTALIRNPGWRVQLGREGQELMGKGLTWQTVAGQFLGLYERYAQEPADSLRSA